MKLAEAAAKQSPLKAQSLIPPISPRMIPPMAARESSSKGDTCQVRKKADRKKCDESFKNTLGKWESVVINTTHLSGCANSREFCKITSNLLKF